MSTKRYERIWRGYLVVVALVMAGLWYTALHYHVGARRGVIAGPTARAHPVAHPGAGRQTSSAPTLPAWAPRAIPARVLTPVSATAFGPYQAGHGDNSSLAPLAIDGQPATAWHTDWYTSARFGNLYGGTGLLVDMGRAVTITAARITLGPARGARLQLRVGTTPSLADLRPVAHAVNAGGVVRMRLSNPARGRYVLIWFTSLPPDPAGTYQVFVYNLRLRGVP